VTSDTIDEIAFCMWGDFWRQVSDMMNGHMTNGWMGLLMARDG